ncbi:MAG: glycosyltransferase family 4 protein [Thermodesulfobacteriota bacterium]
MRICLIGEFSGAPDGGLKNVSRITCEHLAANQEVQVLTGSILLRPSVLRRFLSFRPQVIHYLHGASLPGLIMLKFLSLLAGRGSKSVVSALRPSLGRWARKFVFLLRPDLVLTQSHHFERFFRDHGCDIALLPNGVDCHRFMAVDQEKKEELRWRYNIPRDKKMILYVGHLSSSRKIDIFAEIQRDPQAQVVLVGSSDEPMDKELHDQLSAAGVIIIEEYLEDISELYKAADLFVFPVEESGDIDGGRKNNGRGEAIDMPLSILEAMACNLPVVSTHFGALPRLFMEGGGLLYRDTTAEIVAAVKSMAWAQPVRTRLKVLPLDWQRIIADLENRYRMILSRDRVSSHGLVRQGQIPFAGEGMNEY